MKLYVCWGKFRRGIGRHGHACGNAHHALREAGYEPEVVKAYGFGALPDFLNTPTRRKVKKLTGNSWVPVLITDEGNVISDSKKIIAWAKQHPRGDPS